MAKKMTRNSYKRRIIVIGIMVYACIALISTGFAAWIISTNATAEQNGNISVGKVTDSSITIEDVQLSSSNFYFEPAEGDTTGRIRNNDTDPSESLSVTVTGEVHNAQFLDKLKIYLDLTAAEGVKNAAAAGYIVLPECAQYEVEVTNLTTVNETTKSFEFVVEFKWGTIFDGINPSLYFDKYYENPDYVDESTTPGLPKYLADKGATIADDKMVETLNAFRKIMYNGDDSFDASSDQTDMKFTIVLIGSVN